MGWLSQVPLAVPGFPSLTWAVLIWLGLFAIAGAGFLRELRRAWRVYVRQAAEPDGDAERYLALGLVIQTADSVAIVLAGLAVGVLGATLPYRPQPITWVGVVAFALLLMIPIGKIGQAVIAQQIHDQVSAALRRRPEEA